MIIVCERTWTPTLWRGQFYSEQNLREKLPYFHLLLGIPFLSLHIIQVLLLYVGAPIFLCPCPDIIFKQYVQPNFFATILYLDCEALLFQKSKGLGDDC